MKLKFRLADESDADRWNDFIVKNTPSAFYSLYNLFEWRRVLIHAYGYDPYYIIAENEGEIVGCFPLMYVKSRLFGDGLISLPFTDHGCGPCVKDGDVNVLKLLLEEVRRIAVGLKVKCIKVCSPQGQNTFYDMGYEKPYDYFTFLLDLNKSVDDIWLGFDKRVRNAIRKAQKNDVSVVMDDSEVGVRDLYRIHVDNMKELGTPPHSEKFFRALWSELRPKGLLKNFFAEYDGIRIAAISLFPHRDTVRWGIGVSLAKYRGLNPISLLLWEAIKWANERGYKVFDLGGSRPNSGNFFFKKGWLGKKYNDDRIIELNHLYLFLDNRERNILSPDIPKYKRLSKVWRKCVPIPITMWIGPYIRKQIAM